ncbi:MAG: hypothetical protein BRD52_07815, partial [Bacteroidetes bacterium SW_4_67_19]
MRLARRVLLVLMLLGTAALAAGRGSTVRAQAPDSLAGNERAAHDGVLRADPTVHRDTLDIFTAQPFQLRPFVLPGSERVVVDGVRLDTTQYRLDARAGHLWLDIKPPSGDSRLTVAYRTFPFAFRRVYRRRGVADTTAEGALAVREEDPEASGEGSGF